ERVGEGWFSAVYFLKTREIVEKKLPNNHVTMQFFQKDDAVLCGADEAIALLHTFADNPETLEIYSLKDGDKITPFESVLTVRSERVSEGWFSAVYFLKTREIVEKKLPNNHVTMQFFQKDDAVLCGADEAIALLHTFADNPETLEIYSLKDGDKITPFESVLTV